MSGVEVLEPKSGHLPIVARYPPDQLFSCGTSPVSGVEVLEPNSRLLTNGGKIPARSSKLAVEHLPCLGSESLSRILGCLPIVARYPRSQVI